MKKIYFVLFVYVLAVYSCKKVSNSNPTDDGKYLGDTTIVYNTGLIPLTISELLSIPVVDTSTLPVFGKISQLTLLSSYDLNNTQPGLPPPQKQKYNDCAAWSVVYGMLGYLYGVLGGYLNYNDLLGNLSRDKIFSPAFVYNQNNRDVDSGISFLTAFDFIKHNGCCKLTDMEMFTATPFVQPSSTAVTNATFNKISDFFRLQTVDLTIMKSLLSIRKIPIVFSCEVDNNFRYIWTSDWESRQGNRMVWRSMSRVPIGAHAMVIVGYDDAINAFKVQNSWGNDWGPNKDGFCWIDYNHFKNVVQKLPAGGLENPEIFIGVLYRPIISTIQPGGITSSSVICGGNITNDNNNTITSRGVCWNTAPNPTIANNKTVDGTGTGSFTSSITGLISNTTYYIRAYAVNNSGTTYGNEYSIRTLAQGEVLSATGRIWMDRNIGATRVAISSDDYLAYGYLYQWGRGSDGHQLTNWTSSTIGSPVNGFTTTQATSHIPGHNLFIEGYAYPPAQDWLNPSNDNLWQGINGINNPCPTGFRLPTLAEFTAEIAAFPEQNSTGAYSSVLKLPVAGRRLLGPSLIEGGSVGYYWISSVSTANPNTAQVVLINQTEARIDGSTPRTEGFCVRCIKNQ